LSVRPNPLLSREVIVKLSQVESQVGIFALTRIIEVIMLTDIATNIKKKKFRLKVVYNSPKNVIN